MISRIFLFILMFSFVGVSAPTLPEFSFFDSVSMDAFDSDPEDSEEPVEREEVESEVILAEVSGMFLLSVRTYKYQFNFKKLISSYLPTIFIPPIP